MVHNDFIIVIGRQFGSGGREVGQLLAQRLNLPYYDKHIISEASTNYGINKKLLAEADEKRPSFFRSLIGMTYASPTYHGQPLDNDRLYVAQSNAIRKIIERGPCVIVGRTADYIARDFPNLVSIFLHSDISHRAKRIISRKDCNSMEEALKMAKKSDSLREKYYNYFTGRHWGQADNYHLCINVSDMTPENIVNIILTFLNAKRTHEMLNNKEVSNS